MKFAIAAVVVLAVAMGVQSSGIYQGPALMQPAGVYLGVGQNGLGLANRVGLGYNALGSGVNSIGHGIAPYGGIGVQRQQWVQQPVWVGVPAGVNTAGVPYTPSAVNFVSHIPAAVGIAPHQVSVAHKVAVAQRIDVAQQVGVTQHAAAVAPSLAGHGATYVAKNRGAIHTAPLPGHIKSAASINVAPAPGTW